MDARVLVQPLTVVDNSDVCPSCLTALVTHLKLNASKMSMRRDHSKPGMADDYQHLVMSLRCQS